MLVYRASGQCSELGTVMNGDRSDWWLRVIDRTHGYRHQKAESRIGKDCSINGERRKTRVSIDQITISGRKAKTDQKCCIRVSYPLDSDPRRDSGKLVLPRMLVKGSEMCFLFMAP